MFFFAMFACSTAPKTLEQECMEDYAADSCFLSAVDGNTKENPDLLFKVGALSDSVPARYPVRLDRPPLPWTDLLAEEDVPAVLHGYAVACDRFLPRGCFELGNLIAVELKNPAAALGPYDRACDLHFALGCRALADAGAL